MSNSRNNNYKKVLETSYYLVFRVVLNNLKILHHFVLFRNYRHYKQVSLRFLAIICLLLLMNSSQVLEVLMHIMFMDYKTLKIQY